MSNPFDFFDHIYCINLDKRKDRWEEVQKEFESVGIADKVQRFSAIENTDGRVGVIQSNLALIKMAKENNWDNIMVFEDDAKLDFPGYKEYWNCAKRPGYSGTAILVRENFSGIISVKNGLGLKKFDDEGRVQTVELKKYYLVNVYFPNSNHELSRLGYKIEFNQALLNYLQRIAKKKPVIVTGDYNVAHEPIDLARPEANEGNAGFFLGYSLQIIK
jgi:GR25 family glycosyltransferase involved in LPS biosynthesis